MACDGGPGMTSPPDWLPPMVPVDPWAHNTFDRLYAVFERDFKDTHPVYGGKVVWYFPEVEDGKEVIFRHLTHREQGFAGERLPDMRRCERLPWVRAIIENSEKPEVLTWDYKEGDGSIRTYLWLKDFDFLVLMKKYRDGSRRLITSYLIDYPHKRRKLEKKYQKRIA
jgi:hypothetical protein